MEARKVEDLERKMRVLVEQMDEERAEMHDRLENIRGTLISLSSGRLNTLKTALAHFVL